MCVTSFVGKLRGLKFGTGLSLKYLIFIRVAAGTYEVPDIYSYFFKATLKVRYGSKFKLP